MLPAYIIDQIRKREARREERPQPTLELPQRLPRQRPEAEEEKRGIVIIDL